MKNNARNILVVTYWTYKDALIQAYTLPYLHIIQEHLPRGSKIYLVTFEQAHMKLNMNEKMQVKHRLRLQGIHLITLQYMKFGPMALACWMLYFMRLIYTIIFKRISVIHAWCTPAGSIAYVLSRITRKPLVIDSYEPHAEAMIENKSWKPDSYQFRLLFSLEKKMSKHASVIISATNSMHDYAANKYDVNLTNFFVKPACVDFENFSSDKIRNVDLVRQLKLDDKVTCVYAGKFGGIYLDREVFDFFKVAQDYWKGRFRALILSGHNREELLRWASEAGISKDSLIIKFVPHSDVAEFIGLGDFAITPVKPIPTKKYCTPIKDGEYWALGLPVVITPDISEDSDIIMKKNIGAVINEFNQEEYLRVCKIIDDMLVNKNERKLNTEIMNVASQYRDFRIAHEVYEQVYGNILK
ncbi:MAG: hypothetical protein DWQ39_12280 [Bacteroidetes bacterium]|nr:MAG: hypothetical protein DWQ33_06815 [Bacteroidota bacterium]REJ99701.1 MAG: hypothetical protein DWQ39_12280 [Bacteroidota bacterium]REK47700.1 MAG: hypothetical protein DWQ48_12015 [Bacteroidota bacterium]